MSDAQGPTVTDRRPILLVSWSLPPALNGSSLVVDQLARQFDQSELVLAGELWNDRARRTGLPNELRTHFVSRRREFRTANTWRWLKIPYMTWRLWRLIKSENCSKVVAVFPDEVFLCAAYVAARLRKREFYSYFHNTYLENREGWRRWVARRLQPRVFKHSKAVFVMSDGMHQALATRYPGVPFETLTHAFEGPLPARHSPAPSGKPLRIAFLGNLNSSNIDAMRRVCELIRNRPDYQLTTLNRDGAAYFRRYGLSGDNFSHIDAPFAEELERLREHDIMLLPHGFEGALTEIEYQTIFPTKTIPYLFSGRPILAHCPADSFLGQWLSKHQCAEIAAEPSLDSVGEALQRIRQSDRRVQLVDNARRCAREFEAHRVADRFRDLLGLPTGKSVNMAPTTEKPSGTQPPISTR